MTDTENRGPTGGCLCGAVRYRLGAPAGEAIACHCSQCRRQSGHYTAAVMVDWHGVAIEGQDRVTWYRSSPDARRGFCKVCGSLLFWVSGKDGAAVFAGTLDTPTGARLASHIFVADKGDYYDITDGLPQFAAYPP